MTALASLTACSDLAATPAADYDRVADVPVMSWTASDTLFFPVTITAEDTPHNRLRPDRTYHLRCSVRMTAGFQLTELPMQLIVQQIDTIDGPHLQVVRNLLRHDVVPHLRNSRGLPLGDTWGSMITCEQTFPDVTLRFDSVGTYRMLLVPRTSGIPAFRGISAVGISLIR